MWKWRKWITYYWFIGFAYLSACSPKESIDPVDPAAFVNPFIGTDAHGHTFPGATAPFGMVQLSPNTRLEGWDGVSGYHYSDSLIYGFTHTALSGTGVGDYCDILVMPVVGSPVFSNTEYRSPFKKETEKAEAGYYSVFLEKPGVLAEMTATTRTGYHRYTFPASQAANLIIDLKHRDTVVDSWIEFISDTEIRGMRRSTNWANDLVWYFHMEFSKPFVRNGIAVDEVLREGLIRSSGKNIKAYVGFETSDQEVIEVKVSLSAVDAEGARANMQREIPAWGFEKIRQQTFASWNEMLKKIRVKGGTRDQTTVFYTALYHAFLQPNTYQDVDGRYRGIDRKVHQTTEFTNYTVFSLWDTYRTWHPMMTLIDSTRTVDMINTMLNMYDKGGLLPIWELGGNETYTMIGNHAISVIADAYLKGIRGFDADKALEAMIHSANQDHYGLQVYRDSGYIPGDREHESVSKTLEYAYNDWNIAMMAKAMGKDEVYRTFIRRAQFYKNSFDPSTGFMRPRINGGWLTPFDPTKVDWHFTEANAWHYSFYTPQDMTGLITLHGGKQALADKIETLFTTTDSITGRDMKDISGLIGQYAQGNEPSHHMAYLFNFVNQPWKTQAMVRRIMDGLYKATPDGLSGNEDCGQMSAWLIMSALGFYPVSPGGSTDYVIGTPWFPEAEIYLENGKIFRIKAPKVSDKRYYIQDARLNGKSYTRSWIDHATILQGGELEFTMADQPNTQWGSRDDEVPRTSIEDERLLPSPVINYEDYRIRDTLEVRLESFDAQADLYYTTDGSTPDRNDRFYDKPILLNQPTTLKAIAYREGYGYSYPVEAQFIRINRDRKIQVLSKVHPNYTADGPEALIDGIRGQGNWRLGGWQGYQGTHFEAIIDLGSEQTLYYLGAGFTQDVRSWIWMPKDLQFFASNDGKQYRPVLSVKNRERIDDYEMKQVELGGAVTGKARYLKVKATNFGKIPEWHLGAGGDAYIFIDEIVIKTKTP